MSPFFPLQSPLQPILHNSSQTLNPSFQGYLGYLSFCLISGVVYPRIAPLVVFVQVVKSIWYLKHLEIVKTQVKIEKQQMDALQSETENYLSKIELSTFDEEIEELSKKMELSHASKEKLQKKLIWLNEKKRNWEIASQESHHKCIASAIALIPFVGILAAGLYLKATLPDIQESGLRGCVEAIFSSVAEGSGSLIQTLIYPFRNPEFSKNYRVTAKWYYDKFIDSGASEVQIPVKRGDYQSTISAFAVPHIETGTFDAEKPVMVLFHGNGQSKETMNDRAAFYKARKFNVLAVTMGGYPWSDEGINTSEKTTYQDADAAINYLKDLGFKNIGIHGLSIGGTLAFAAAQLHPDVVKFVIAEQTLGKAKDVAVNVIRNQISTLIPEAVIRGVVGNAFPVGRLVPGVTDFEGKPYLTDGLNNVRKSHILRQQSEKGVGNCWVYAIRAKRDEMMGRIRDKSGFKENYSDDIIMARYATLEGHVAEVPGGHCSWFSKEDQSKELSEQLETVFFS